MQNHTSHTVRLLRRALTFLALLLALPAGAQTYTAILNGQSESPPNNSPGTGIATVTYNAAARTLRVQAIFSGLTGNTTAAHIHGATASAGTGTAGVMTTVPSFVGFPLGVTAGAYDQTFDLALGPSYNAAFLTANGGTPATAEPALINAIASGRAYFNIHTSTFPGGEIRGFFRLPTVVTTIADSGAGSLRQAVLNANANPGADTITFSDGTGGTVNFTDSTPETITLSSQLLVDDSVTIVGPGTAKLSISGNNATRIFNLGSVTPGISVNLSGLSLNNGRVEGAAKVPGGANAQPGFGGAIRSVITGTLTLTDCAISNCAAIGGSGLTGQGNSGGNGLGGAIAHEAGGTLRLTRTTFTSNSTTGGDANGSQPGGTAVGGAIHSLGPVIAIQCSFVSNQARGGSQPGDNGPAGAAVGGALAIDAAASLTIHSSTLSGNSAIGGATGGAGGIALGGGIYSAGATTVAQCTISGNSVFAGRSGGFRQSASATGGGICVASVSAGQITQSTITANSATGDSNALTAGTGTGGGIATTSAAVNLANTIVASNTGSTSDPDLTGSFSTSGNNLVGNLGTATGLANGTSGDQVGSGASPINALLGPLANNGGLTQTHSLLAGSPAFNTGLPANLPADTFDLDGDSNTTELLSLDQRGIGFARSVGTVDIGAYEALYVQLAATTASAAEGTGAGTTAFTFTVSRPGATTDAVTVNYAVTGTGTNPADAADFGGTLPSGTLTLPAGVASDIITIAVSKDATIETDETFTLTLSNPTANHAIVGNGAVATITNDDVLPPNSAPTNITLSNASIAENNTPGATIGTLTATDADAGQTHTFTFASPLAPTLARAVAPPANDNAAFSITGNVLSINGSANFEAKSSYNIRVRATDNGDPALSFEKNFTIVITDVTIPQTITFAPLGGKTFGDAAFSVSATGGASGQPVTFGISGPATIAGNLVTITGAGDVTVTASQAGAGDFSAAAPVPRTFTVAKAAQTITFAPAGTAQQTDSVTLTATGGASGNAVTFSLVSGPGSLAGDVLTFTADGTVIVRASQAGNANYNAAADVDATIVVGASGPVTTGNFFTGLLTDGTGRVRGSFLARLGSTGFGTLTVWADGKRGSIKVLGETTRSIVVGGTPMTVNFPVGPVSPSGNPTRSVTLNIGAETLTGTAVRSPYEQRRRTPNAGKYTFAATLPPSTSGAGAGLAGATVEPAGPKLAAAMSGSITSLGAVRITARLGNGRVATFNSQEQGDGKIAVYCGYGIGGAQSLAGTLAFTSATAPQMTGLLRWTVPAGVDVRVPAGVDADYDAIGARYTPGGVGNLLALDAAKRVTLSFQSTGLFSGTPQSYTFPMTTNVVAFLPERPYGQIRFFPATGMFSGTTSFESVRRNIHGVLLQGEDLNYGIGYLEDTTTVGTVSIEPADLQ